MSQFPDRAIQQVLSEIEALDFRIQSEADGGVILNTTLPFDLHVRPATFIYGRLCEQLSFSRLRLRRTGNCEWTDFQPLSLVAMALGRGEQVEIKVLPPFTRECIVELASAFRECPRYRDYDNDEARGELATGGHEEEGFRQEFESEDGAYCLIKLNIENFIIGHLAEIEAYILKHSPRPITDGAELRRHFKLLLLDIFANFGMVTLDLPLDNLIQTRDMCYHLHFAQIQKRERIPYAVMGIEWGKEAGSAWRRTQTRRHCYYYEQEADFYCGLFLVMVLREAPRLQRFVTNWGERLDYSLRLRHGLREQLQKIEREMEKFCPNFENPEEFLHHIRLMGKMVSEDITRLTPFMELLRAERIYHPALLAESSDVA